MHFSDLITPQRVKCDVSASSKKRVLEQLSDLIVAGEPGLAQSEVFESLVARERLGSTGLGKGVAIPHGRLRSGKHAVIAFQSLTEGVDFDSPDGEPVDLLCALVVPAESTEEHLQILALLTEMFSDTELREKVRDTHSDQALYDLLVDWSAAREH